jgi:hypothetical protein
MSINEIILPLFTTKVSYRGLNSSVPTRVHVESPAVFSDF